ncbi:MAG TPA: hypothetical protein VF736_11210 [Pyrinomonadaceae bacterium]|jgi:hypothetical protein
MKTKPSELSARRGGERGAALITALLVSMLLLAAGGALVITTGMSATNAVDATAEAQAYYAADAGIQAALSVIRRNKPSSPAGTPADFHHLVCGVAATCTNTGGSLAAWLPYDAALGAVKLSDSPRMTYNVTVTDAGRAAAFTLTAAYQPRYLLVRSVGRGPKGATKVLEMMVSRFKFDYSAPAPLVLRESEDGLSHVTLIPGPGQPNVYSGTDVSNPAVTLPAVGVGGTTFLGTTDFTLASTATAAETLTGGVGVVGNAAMPWPSVVADAPTAAATVQGLREFATSTACPANNQALSGLTFIEGNCTLGPNNSGSGFLVITGTLTMSGNFNFSGLIFALGAGRVVRSGGGGGTVQGGILAANFAGNGSGGFGRVVFDTSGGGNSQINYNSLAIENALAEFGPRPLGIVER